MNIVMIWRDSGQGEPFEIEHRSYFSSDNESLDLHSKLSDNNESDFEVPPGTFSSSETLIKKIPK